MNQKNRIEKLELKAKKKKEIIFQFDPLPNFKNEIEFQNYLKEIEVEMKTIYFDRLE